MFGILGKSLSTGIVTTRYPAAPADLGIQGRGRPKEIDWANWADARSAAAICPTGAISYEDSSGKRIARLDMGKCIFCGLCADVDKSIRMTNDGRCAARKRGELVASAQYSLRADGTQGGLLSAVPLSELNHPAASAADRESVEIIGGHLRERAIRIFGRSLHIREVDAGSCNGCEIEITNLISPVYDVERFGLHFVASPRHADMLLVTGPVARNMELALRKTYDATPEPRLVVAVGACGCSGGIFGVNYATRGGVDQVIPVDLYIPGCPPSPLMLLDGLLGLLGRIDSRF